jgi:hypothetical protein
MAVLALAGALKLLDIPSWGQALREYTFLGHNARSVVVFALPPIELAVGLSWLLGARSIALA